MGNPRTLRVELDSYGYHMEVDVSKDDCNREPPHWHLCHRGSRIGQISPSGYWTRVPDVSANIIRQAEELTSYYEDEIIETYNHNRSFGAG